MCLYLTVSVCVSVSVCMCVCVCARMWFLGNLLLTWPVLPRVAGRCASSAGDSCGLMYRDDSGSDTDRGFADPDFKDLGGTRLQRFLGEPDFKDMTVRGPFL